MDISDAMFQKRLAFLADIFTYLNELNWKLQVANIRVLLQDNICAFIANLKLWKANIQAGQKVAAFPTMNKLSCTNGVNSIIQSEAIGHFSLIKEFYCYFPCVKQNTPVMALQGTLSEFLLKIYQMNTMKRKGKAYKKSFWT